MIDDADLLQANATIIAGILIFLTLIPISKIPYEIILEKRIVLGLSLVTMIFLVASLAFLLFFDGVNTILTNNVDIPILIAKVFFMSGLITLIATIAVILSEFRRPECINRQNILVEIRMNEPPMPQVKMSFVTTLGQNMYILLFMYRHLKSFLITCRLLKR
jgi:hypothetical protein